MKKNLFGFLIDDDLKKRLKVKCAQKGITVTSILTQLIENWLKEK
jgi:hypothetical protein